MSTLGIEVGPNQTRYGRFGDVIKYKLKVINNQTVTDYIDITVTSGPSKWSVSIFMADELTLLRDSPGDGDGLPDTGPLAPTASFEFVVKVTIPHNQPFNEPEVTLVTASSTLSPSPNKGMCKLVTKSYPHLDATKSVSRVQIYEEAGAQFGLNTHTRVTLNVKGGGIPTQVMKYHDVVFLIDNTGSMTSNDPDKLRLEAANSYVDNMSDPDQGAVVTFYGTGAYPRGYAWLARGPNNPVEHISGNYKRLKENINWTGNIITGGTNILRAMQVGVNEMIAYGNPGNVWYIILLTDGYDSGNVVSGDRDNAIRSEAQNAANNNIVVFTIGLGSTVNTQLLKDVANITSGKYYSAENASQLMEIYNQIHHTVSKVAGRDININDDVSMIKDVLPDYIHYVPDSFRVEPGSMDTSADPSLIEQNLVNTTFHWDVEKIFINQSWIVSFEITSIKTGWVPVGVYPEARVRYTDWGNNTEYYLAFPEVWVEVLPIPRPDLVPFNVAVNGKLYDPRGKIEVQRGEEITISASVKNQGALSTAQFSAGFDLGFFNSTHPQSPFFTTNIGTLAIDETSVEHFGKWLAPFTIATFELLVVADWSDAIPEGTEGEANNIFNLTIHVIHNPIIDLIPVNTKVDDILLAAPPNNIIEVAVHNELKLELQVENRGNENTNYYTSLFQVVLANRLTPETAIGVQDIYSLSAGSYSRVLVFIWEAPPEPGIVELVIDVDSTNAVFEGTQGELNNRVSITVKVVKDTYIDLVPNSLAVNGVDKNIPDVSSITETVHIGHQLLIGQMATIEFTIYSIANEPSNFFAASFGILAFNASASGGQFFKRFSLENIEPESRSEKLQIYWRAPVLPGTYIVVLSIDHKNDIDEGTLGENNNLVNMELEVFDVPGQPEPVIELDPFSSDSIIKWSSVPGSYEYEVFGGTEPDEMDLTKPLTSTTDLKWRHVNARSHYTEFYYTVRAKDERGWAGPTGAIVGFYTKQFFRGYNTFSLPLQPFETRTADWYADQMLSFDFETIYYYDEEIGRWIGHPKFLPGNIDNFNLEQGESYMLYSTGDFIYTFIGRPETVLRYSEGMPGQKWLGSDPMNEQFRKSLKLTVRQAGILLEWSSVGKHTDPESTVRFYEVYRQEERGGLNLSSAIDSAPSGSHVSHLATTRLTKFIDTEPSNMIYSSGFIDYNEPVKEYTYIVIPVSELGIRGGSTYSKTIALFDLETGYNSFAHTLIGATKTHAYDFINEVGKNDVDCVYYYDNSLQSWIGHPRFLPDFRDNPEMQMSEGYLIYILAESGRLDYQIT